MLGTTTATNSNPLGATTNVTKPATTPQQAQANVTQAKVGAVEHRKVEELLRSWEERISNQTTTFARFADQILQVDTSIIANANKLREMSQDTSQLRHKQETVDQSIKQLNEQQDSLAQLLNQLQDALATRGGGARAEGTATHSKAVMLYVFF